MWLSEYHPEHIPIGLRVISASVLRTHGRVSQVSFVEGYAKDDIERNPIVKIKWNNGNISIQPLAFLDKILVYEDE